MSSFSSTNHDLPHNFVSFGWTSFCKMFSADLNTLYVFVAQLLCSSVLRFNSIKSKSYGSEESRYVRSVIFENRQLVFFGANVMA